MMMLEVLNSVGRGDGGEVEMQRAAPITRDELYQEIMQINGWMHWICTTPIGDQLDQDRLNSHHQCFHACGWTELWASPELGQSLYDELREMYLNWRED